MLKGRFKVFSTCREFFTEFVQYHRKETGKIAKTHDDIMDAVRYAYMMRRYAVEYGRYSRFAPPVIESSI
jgi:hypothetical protein